MMRNIQGYSVSRGYQPYPHHNTMNRYPQVRPHTVTHTHKLIIMTIFWHLQDLFQMGASSYPGMTQPFSMAHSTNMGSVGVRQDSMGEYAKQIAIDNNSNWLALLTHASFCLTRTTASPRSLSLLPPHFHCTCFFVPLANVSTLRRSSTD